MVKVESKRNGDQCECSVTLSGSSEDIINEALSVIWSLMKDIKKTDKAMHIAMIDVLVHCDYILMGEEEDSEDVRKFREWIKTDDGKDALAMAMAIVTDKSVLN